MIAWTPIDQLLASIVQYPALALGLPLCTSIVLEHVYRRKNQLSREPLAPTYLMYVLGLRCPGRGSDNNTCFSIAHATKVPGLIFLSGQTPVGSDGQVVAGGIKEHTVSSA